MSGLTRIRIARTYRWAIAAACASVALAAALLFPQAQRPAYPYVVVQVADSVRLDFLHQIQPAASCGAFVNSVAGAVLARCSQCEITQKSCLTMLTPRQRNLLNGKVLDTPVLRTSSGIVALEGANSELNLDICAETERQSLHQLMGVVRCIGASDDVLQLPLASTNSNRLIIVPKMQAALGVIFFGAVISFVICYLLLYSARFHGRFSHDPIESGPQKFHAIPTPRIGGIAIALGFAGSILLLGKMAWVRPTSVYAISLLALAAVPAFAGGLAEDLTKRISAFTRLMLTVVAAVVASLVIGATIERTDIVLLDFVLQWPLFAMAFTVFAIAGIANAMNVIDGYNGLSSGYAILVLVALAWVSSQAGDQLVLIASLAMLGALIGFFAWNYPAGKIFMGDGGAYLVGLWLAEMSILLAVRNPEVSPWLPLVLLIYPIMEVSVSVYRKKVLRGQSASEPDRLHFHMLIHQRLTRIKVGARDADDITYRNSLVARYIWIAASLFILPSVLFWRNSLVLFGLAVSASIAYVWLYLRLLQWRAPTWMIMHPKPGNSRHRERMVEINQ